MRYKKNLFFLWLGLTQLSSAQEPKLADLSLYVQPTYVAINQIRQNWLPFLSEEQNDIERSINWYVPLTWNSNGFAVRHCETGDNRQIIITAGQAFVLTQLVDALLRTSAGQMSRACYSGYLRHMADVFTANTHNPGSMPFYSPAAFADSSPSICTVMSGEAMSKEQWDNLFNKLMIDSLNLLAAHELGHQINNHGCKNRTTSEIRQDEQEADDFAIELTIKEDPAKILGAIPLLTFWSMNSPMTTADEFGNTHPAGLRRLRYALDAIERNLNESNQSDLYLYLESTNKLSEFRDLLMQLRNDTSGLN